MTATDLIKLSRRIDTELVSIEQAVARAEAGWEKYKISGDEFLVDSVALNLHGLVLDLL